MGLFGILRFLAEKAGVELKPQTAEEQAAAEEFENLRLLLEEASTFYRHQLLNTPPGRSALEYLHQRGLTDETIEAFGLGYAPNSWDAVLNFFKSRGAREDDLIQAGLLSERDSGGYYDRFRHRLMFPIRDERGRMAGFGARILNPDDVPKFLNSPQTVVFDKGRLLYGLDRARKNHPYAGPGGNRRRLPGCDRPAPGRFFQCCFPNGHGFERAPTIPD